MSLADDLLKSESKSEDIASDLGEIKSLSEALDDVDKLFLKFQLEGDERFQDIVRVGLVKSSELRKVLQDLRDKI